MTSRRIHTHTGPRKQYDWTKETSHWYCRRQFHVHISHSAPSFGTNISCDSTGLAASFLKSRQVIQLNTMCMHGQYKRVSMVCISWDFSCMTFWIGLPISSHKAIYMHTCTECINICNTTSQITLQKNYRQLKMHLIIMGLAIIY